MPKPYDVYPLLRPHGDRFWQINEVTFFGSRGESWKVPPGVTDFASVPRIAVWLIPKFGKWTTAALLHDWFCREGIARGLISPMDADGVFRSVMRRDGVPPLLRNLAWAGVRWGAAGNPVRRHEWWRTFPRLLGISLIALPILLIPAIVIALGLAIYWPLEWAAWIVRSEVPESDAGGTT